jgi:hypothetical protein
MAVKMPRNPHAGWQQLIQSFAASGFVVSEDHFAHGFDAVTFKEHVFGAAKSDS